MRPLALVAAALLLGWTPPAEAPAAKAPRFHGTAVRIDPATRERMTGVSWHPGCPVGLGDLRLLTVSRWGFDGSPIVMHFRSRRRED